MEIQLSNGNVVSFLWQNAAGLQIDLVAPPVPGAEFYNREQTWPVVASTTLQGETLLDFLSTFIIPLMRRCLAVAIESPHQTGNPSGKRKAKTI